MTHAVSPTAEIIDVAPRAGNEPLGFFSSNSLADRRVDRKFHKVLRLRATAGRPTFL